MKTETSVSLQGQNLHGDANAVPVARAIKTSATLTELNVSGCSLYSRGVLCIAKALEANPPLVTLLAGTNHAGGAAISAPVIFPNADLSTYMGPHAVLRRR